MKFTNILLVVGIYTAATVDAVPFLHKRATTVVSRTSPPAGALVVRQKTTNTSEYATIQSAVVALGSNKSAKSIFIYPGTYTEQVKLAYNGPLTIYGYTSDVSSYKGNQVNVQYSLNSTYAGTLDASAVISAHQNNLTIYNLNVANTFGKGAPALALSALGDRQAYYGCSFKGYQDTLMASANHQYYSKCYIEGATDFIFGDASAWFGDCTIGSLGGPITAMSRTLANETSWYVFDNSIIQAATGQSVASGSVFLGRPWRVNARVMYQNSNLGIVVAPAGWTTMAANATPIYQEWNNVGAGNNTSKRLYETKATGPVNIATVLGADYMSWINSAY